MADALGMVGEATPIQPFQQPVDLDPSPALRLYGKYPPTLKGRKVGVLLAPGFDMKLKNALINAIKKEGATTAIIAPKVGGVEDASGEKQAAEMALRGRPPFCSMRSQFLQDRMATNRSRPMRTPSASSWMRAAI